MRCVEWSSDRVVCAGDGHERRRRGRRRRGAGGAAVGAADAQGRAGRRAAPVLTPRAAPRLTSAAALIGLYRN